MHCNQLFEANEWRKLLPMTAPQVSIKLKFNFNAHKFQDAHNSKESIMEAQSYCEIIFIPKGCSISFESGWI